MKRNSYKIFFMGVMLLSGRADAAAYSNSMTKAYFHKSEISDKIVCYFTKDPVCNQLPKAMYEQKQEKSLAKASAIKEIRFFMPLTQIVGEAKNAVPTIEHAPHEHYSISFKGIHKPMEGIEVAIAYDPRYIGFEFETFDAIHTHKGVIFKFHHKTILQELNKRTDHILQYAFNSYKSPVIMIDNGHGGDDAGKIGHYNIKEKDINLEIGSYLGQLLKKKGYTVLFTRTADIFVPLDVRTTRANKQKADLFVSIHVNGSIKEAASGIETYWAPRGLLKREFYDLDDITNKALVAMDEYRDKRSKCLATHMHNNVLLQAKKFYAVKDRTVKESISQVLLGTDMPAVLLELGFLSNYEEIKFLTQQEYKKAMAQGMCAGIEAYLKEA